MFTYLLYSFIKIIKFVIKKASFCNYHQFSIFYIHIYLDSDPFQIFIFLAFLVHLQFLFHQSYHTSCPFLNSYTFPALFSFQIFIIHFFIQLLLNLVWYLSINKLIILIAWLLWKLVMLNILKCFTLLLNITGYITSFVKE